MPPPPPCSVAGHGGASLLLELYLDGSGTRTAPLGPARDRAASCEGSFAFVLLDGTRAPCWRLGRRARTRTALLGHGARSRRDVFVQHSASGSAPTEREWDGSTLFASDPMAIDAPCGGAAAAFPLGAFYYVDETMAYGAIQRLNPEGASRAKRAVKPVHRINSSGKVCGLGFYTESGNDLASLAGKYIA